MNSCNNDAIIKSKERKWVKPSVKTIHYDELRKIVTASACSSYVNPCKINFAK